MICGTSVRTTKRKTECTIGSVDFNTAEVEV